MSGPSEQAERAETCDHAAEAAGGYIACEATGPHSVHYGWHGFPAKRSHRWTDAESVCGSPTPRECPDVG